MSKCTNCGAVCDTTLYQVQRNAPVEELCDDCLEFAERSFPNEYDSESDEAQVYKEEHE